MEKNIRLYALLVFSLSRVALYAQPVLFDANGLPIIDTILALDMPVKEVNESQLSHILATDKNAKVINVLGQRFYDDCHITGSIAVPMRKLWQVAKTWTDKKQTIVVYCACQECDASQKAFKLLTIMGFENVYAYEGGIRAWYKLRLPCSGPCAQSYLEEEGDSYNCVKVSSQ